ncbi:MAG TPA: molybdopterin cofactor-binding domain-containing protein, partial [Burkholderiaceae bacterium]|nr:molybdopterin cofactor-binding domain-containing protein [Burkholderiaceae bacterium]
MRRRTWLLAGSGALGALIVGWGALPPRSRLGRAALLDRGDAAIALNGWLRIAPDGSVQLAMPKSEMGQGVHTALAMLVAEELEVPLASVRLVEAGHDAIYGNVAMFAGALPVQPEDSQPGRETPRVRFGRWMVAKLAREFNINATGGSSTIADLWLPLRTAAATARGQLLGAASLQWKLPVAELTITDGVVRHPTGEHAHFGELVQAAARTPPGDVTLKPREAWKLIGKPAPRTDAQSKSDGSARFGIDVRLPGMLYAVVRHAPAIGGSPGAVDATRAFAVPGVERVVRLGSYAGSTPALAVVGKTTWHAKRGADALEVDWRARLAGAIDLKAIMASLDAAARREGDGFAFHAQGDAPAQIAASPNRVEATYTAPYLAHAAMEPINCTAQVADGKVEVWAPTQVPGMARALAARVAGVAPDAVTLHVTQLGGGFGRRLDIDFVGQAVRVAMDCGGRPVQLVWPREEDLTHDFYRPAGVARLRAATDSDGRMTALDIQSAGDAPTPRWVERAIEPQSPRLAAALGTAGDLVVPQALQPALRATTGPLLTPDRTAGEGLFDLPYAIAHQRIAHVATRHAVPVGFWRAVGHSHNAFFVEGFIDELAHRAQHDPVDYRLAMLADMPRHAAVLKLAADKAGWKQALPKGRARGVALHESFDSIVAEVAEVSLGADGRTPRVHRVVCAVDCGIVVNPGIVAQQMESGIVFALSAALYGRIDFDAQGAVKQRNFPDYPLLSLKDTPA